MIYREKLGQAKVAQRNLGKNQAVFIKSSEGQVEMRACAG